MLTSILLGIILATLPLNASAGNTVYQSGEKLKMTVHYKWGPIDADVCNGTFTVNEASFAGKRCYNARIYAKTGKTVGKMVKLVEDFQSYISMDSGLPQYFKRDTQEGSYWLKDECKVNWSGKKLEAAIESSSKGAFTKTLPFSTTTYDVSSMICAVRNFDLAGMKDGQSSIMNLYLAPDILPVSVKKVGSEVRNVKGIGKVNTIKVTVRSASSEGQDLSLDIWFSDDDNHIPVYMQAKLKIGRIYATLNDYSGLKSEFTALQK